MGVTMDIWLWCLRHRIQ